MPVVKELYKKSWSYRVLKNEKTGEHFIEVLCGSHALYDVTVKLEEKEIEQFKKDETALDDLAAKITYDHSEFKNRIVKNFNK